jgi:hypothetical protein
MSSRRLMMCRLAYVPRLAAEVLVASAVVVVCQKAISARNSHVQPRRKSMASQTVDPASRPRPMAGM